MTLMFWVLSYFSCLELFSRTGDYRIIDVIYTLLFHIPLIYAVSIHSFYLLPNYLAKVRFTMYAVMLLGLYGTSIPLYYFSYEILSNWLFEGFYLVGVYTPLEVAGIITIYLILSAGLEFGRSWFSSLRAKNKIIELESEKTTSELKMLRAQIHPHFLFNSLNTIYSEALKKSDKAPSLILKLSEILRYVVDKVDMETVSLENEINYLKLFVDLHRERVNDPEKVHFKVEGTFKEQHISPLLLITFIENCFKHGDLTDEDSMISIHLLIAETQLILKCENTVFHERGKAVNETEGGGGTGLKNARRRLELSYPGKHELDIQQRDDHYKLILKLNLD